MLSEQCRQVHAECVLGGEVHDESAGPAGEAAQLVELARVVLDVAAEPGSGHVLVAALRGMYCAQDASEEWIIEVHDCLDTGYQGD